MAYSYFELPRPPEIVNQETLQLGMKIVRDQSGNTLRLSQSKFYNGKLVQTLLEGHSILSLEGSLSGDCDVEKNGKWSCIYAVGSHEYQMVCTRLDIASADVGMLDKFDRRLQTDVQEKMLPGDEKECPTRHFGILDVTPCGSKYWISDIEDKPVEDKFVQRHNHYLVDKENLQFLKSCRKLTFSQKVLIHHISNLNMGPDRVFKLMKKMYNGFENIGATTTDCKNEIRDMNVFVGEDDAQMVVDKLLSKQEIFHDFFVSYKTYENDVLTGLFWADEEAKRNYLCFGDVVSFDATYRSNKHNMVLVLMRSSLDFNKKFYNSLGRVPNRLVVVYERLGGCYRSLGE
ncbi:zinc finger, CCHC-type containing protein [Tanacetum coccineum]